MTNLNPEHVENLLNNATPAPWELVTEPYLGAEQIGLTGETVAVKIGPLEHAEDSGQHFICIGTDEDAEIAALAPQLAQEWLRMREELVGWLATLKQATHEAPDEYLRLACKETAHTVTRILGEQP